MHCEAHYRPWEIDELSLGHAVLALTDPAKKGPPAGHVPMTDAEQLAHVARVRAMTPRQRLEMAREAD